jgi:hypothetical protein
MTTIRISIAWVDPYPQATAGLHHISEIMPHVLNRYGLAPGLETELVPSAAAMVDQIRPQETWQPQFVVEV